MTEPRGVAVVGLGIGRIHVRAYRRLRDRFRVVAVSDIDEKAAVEVAERIECDVATFDELLARDDIGVVNICTPPRLHVEQCVAVLQAGKHVVCEKPLAGSLADCDTLAAAEAASNGRLMPIFQYRFGFGLQQVKALVDAGVAGPLSTSSVELAWRRRPEYYAVPWRGKWETELGGVLTSQAIHLLDMLTYVAGPVSSVFCRAVTRVNEIEVEDTVAASLLMADGSLAAVTATLGSPEELSRHRFHFARFSAESGTAPYDSSAPPWRITPDDHAAAADIANVLESVPERADGWQGQFERFADALDAGADPPVTLADARASLELLTALYASSRSGRDEPLPIPSDHPMYGGWQP